MKNKIIVHSLSILLVIFVGILLFNDYCYAATLPELKITSYNYSVGDKIGDYDVKEVQAGKTLQLYAVMEHGNDIYVSEEDAGWFVDEINLRGVTWTSSDTSVATVNQNGLVTGIKEGDVVIAANYNGDTANYGITVRDTDVSTGSSISFADQWLTPRPTYIVGDQDYCFVVNLIEISEEERGKIEYSIEDTSKAKIVNSDSCTNGVAVKFLSPGTTKIIARLGSFLDSYEFTILKDISEMYLLSITSSKDKIYVGETTQLNVIMTYGTTAPEDVTSDSKTVYSSSNDKVAKVDKNGLVTGVSAGKAAITVIYDNLVTKTYEITVEKKESSSIYNPNTGNVGSIIVGLILIGTLIAMFAYTNFRYNKNN